LGKERSLEKGIGGGDEKTAVTSELGNVFQNTQFLKRKKNGDY
jgi:hypothetical protein